MSNRRRARADISRREREIDQLTYQLYHSNGDEIAIVEGSAQRAK